VGSSTPPAAEPRPVDGTVVPNGSEASTGDDRAARSLGRRHAIEEVPSTGR
jgi:hypothetical protein